METAAPQYPLSGQPATRSAPPQSHIPRAPTRSAVDIPALWWPLSYATRGASLGAAVAIELALSDPPAALVLRSPFTFWADLADVHSPFPVRALLRDGSHQSTPTAE